MKYYIKIVISIVDNTAPTAKPEAKLRIVPKLKAAVSFNLEMFAWSSPYKSTPIHIYIYGPRQTEQPSYVGRNDKFSEN